MIKVKMKDEKMEFEDPDRACDYVLDKVMEGYVVYIELDDSEKCSYVFDILQAHAFDVGDNFIQLQAPCFGQCRNISFHEVFYSGCYLYCKNF